MRSILNFVDVFAICVIAYTVQYAIIILYFEKNSLTQPSQTSGFSAAPPKFKPLPSRPGIEETPGVIRFFFPFYCICRLHFGFQVSHLRKLCFGNLRNSRPLAHISTFLTQLGRFEGILKTQEYWKTLLEFLPKNKAKNESNRAKMN